MQLHDRRAIVARTAHDAERRKLWDVMTELCPAYLRYQETAGREIPVVVLERLSR